MSARKKEIRKNFNEACLERDNYKCRVCGSNQGKLDVHHITDRTELPNDGYVKENGITLCENCHIKAERFHITAGLEWEYLMHPDDLYRKINSSKEEAQKASESIA